MEIVGSNPTTLIYGEMPELVKGLVWKASEHGSVLGVQASLSSLIYAGMAE